MGDPRPSPAAQLAAVMTRLYGAGLTTPSGGNLSVLAEDGGLWVTPSQIDKGRLAPEHMVRIAPDGSWAGAFQPTSEWPFHRAVLRARPDCRAVAHAHPGSLVAFCVTGRPLPLDQFPDLGRWVNRVGFSSYATPGSARLAELLGGTFAEGCDAALMENHGAVACGRDPWEAFRRLAVLEQLAAILLAGARLGPLRPRSEGEMRAARARMGRPWEAFGRGGTAAQARAREELADLVRRAHGRGLLGGAGALSARHGEGFLIAPDGADGAGLRPEELVYVEGGRCEAGKVPEATADLHAAVYRAHPRVDSVATALPPGLMAFAASGTAFDVRLLPEAYMCLQSVPSLPFEARFDASLAARALGPGRPAALIESACAVVTGATPFQAFDRLEVAESTARTILDSAVLGPLKPMGGEALEEIRRAYGI